MKKSELNLVSVGSEIKSKKTNEVLTVNNITEVEGKVKYELSNGKTTTQSSLLRWYELQSVEPVATKPVEPVEVKPVEPVEVKPVEPVEVEPVEPVEVKPVEPVEVKPVEPVEVKPVEPVEVKPVNLVDQIVEYANTHKYIVKHNSDHIVIKGSNKKNLVEIHSSKKAINLVVRHQLYSEDEQMVLNNCRIVGNGTFVLDLKFEITKLDEFINTLNRATAYVPSKKSKK